MKSLKGIYSALLISFNEDGSLDEQGTRGIIRHNIDNVGVDGLYVGGSTGENFTLDTATKRRIFEIAADEVAGKVALIAQIGSNDVKEAIELGLLVKSLGYDAVSAVTPYYYKFSFAEIKAYYSKITEAVGLPMIIYSIPFLTGVNLSEEQFGELFAVPGIIGVKFTAADFYLLERVRFAFPDKLIFFGFDELLLPSLCYQVDGAIGSTYNLSGKLAKEIYSSALAGDLAHASKVQHKLNNFITAVLKNGLYQTLKEGLRLSGVQGSLKMHGPMAQATPEQVAKVPEILELLK